jgi:excisionase family DNA binding protein
VTRTGSSGARDASLVRPSELARFWKVHPRTVNSWIHDGRLVAVRSPGNHYRVRAADVAAFCEKEGLARPPLIEPALKTVLVIGASAAIKIALRRVARGAGATFEAHDGDDALRVLFAAVIAPPAVLAISDAIKRVDAGDVTRALRATASTSATTLVIFDVASASRAAELTRAGATRAMLRSQGASLAEAILELLSA